MNNPLNTPRAAEMRKLFSALLDALDEAILLAEPKSEERDTLLHAAVKVGQAQGMLREMMNEHRTRRSMK